MRGREKEKRGQRTKFDACEEREEKHAFDECF
jgi:hypothetical protein